MFAHLHVDRQLVYAILPVPSNREIKIDRVKANMRPISVPCLIFNEILSFRDWWSENNGHWLIRTQAWAATD